MLMFQIIPSRVCGLKTLQDLSCCYLLAAGSHWNPWNNKLNLFVPLPEAQSELLLFESCYSSGKFNLNFMWSSGGTFRGTETRPHSQAGPRKCHSDNATHSRHGGRTWWGTGSDQTNNAGVRSPSRQIMPAKNMDLKTNKVRSSEKYGFKIVQPEFIYLHCKMFRIMLLCNR